MTDDGTWDANFDRMPDLWYQNGVDRRACYWCIDGVWYWRIVLDDGQVLAEGVGGP